jgi:paired small multidrug resistance pump
MTIEWYDYLGTAGVLMILIAYFLLQAGRLASAALAYSVLNLLGASFITVSLLFDFNLSAFVIEVCWVAISLYGIMRYLRDRHDDRRHTPG